MTDQRWPPFELNDETVTLYDAIIARDVYQKIDFWTCYMPSKFHCHCSNILEVKEEGRNLFLPPPSNGLKRPKKARVWIWFNKVPADIFHVTISWACVKGLPWLQIFCTGSRCFTITCNFLQEHEDFLLWLQTFCNGFIIFCTGCRFSSVPYRFSAITSRFNSYMFSALASDFQECLQIIIQWQQKCAPVSN